MPRSSSPRQGDPRYWRQWTVRGANLDQIISPQQRTHYLRFSLLPHKQGGKRLCTLQGSCDHKKSKREKETSTFSSRRKEQRNVTFFFKGAFQPSTEAGRARASSRTLHILIRTEKGISIKGDGSPSPTGKVAPLPRAKVTTGPKSETPQRKF